MLSHFDAPDKIPDKILTLNWDFAKMFPNVKSPLHCILYSIQCIVMFAIVHPGRPPWPHLPPSCPLQLDSAGLNSGNLVNCWKLSGFKVSLSNRSL
jgi:hypothetical protein